MKPVNPCRDHAGGNEEMAKRIPGLKIVGGAHDRVAACTAPVEEGDEVSVGEGVKVKALFTPWSVVSANVVSGDCRSPQDIDFPADLTQRYVHNSNSFSNSLIVGL